MFKQILFNHVGVKNYCYKFQIWNWNWENCISTPPHLFLQIEPPPHLNCKFFHFETYVPKPTKGLVFGCGGSKCEEFFDNEEIKEVWFFSTYEWNLRRNSRKRRNRRNIVSIIPKLAQRPELGGGPEIEEFVANEESEEMHFSPRSTRTRKEFHANEESEEMLGHMFPRWP